MEYLQGYEGAVYLRRLDQEEWTTPKPRRLQPRNGLGTKVQSKRISILLPRLCKRSEKYSVTNIVIQTVTNISPSIQILTLSALQS